MQTTIKDKGLETQIIVLYCILFKEINQGKRRRKYREPIK